MYIQNHYVKNNYMPLHKLNQAKKYKLSIGKKKKKTCTIPIFFFSFKVNPRPFTNPRYACAHRHTLVHKLLTLEHSDKHMSLWLV